MGEADRRQQGGGGALGEPLGERTTLHTGAAIHLATLTPRVGEGEFGGRMGVTIKQRAGTEPRGGRQRGVVGRHWRRLRFLPSWGEEFIESGGPHCRFAHLVCTREAPTFAT